MRRYDAAQAPPGFLMSSPPQDAAPAPAALSAFLRGIERRGAVFAELQCGDADAGDAALAAAMRAFRNHAATVPMADWPRRFWTLLVTVPQMRKSAATAHWPADVRPLSAPESAHRQALLLRLAAGLSEEEAARVLSLGTEAYEQALAAACPRDGQGRPDAVAWRALAEAIQQRLRDLPPERLARLARLRESALSGQHPARPQPVVLSVAKRATPARSHRRWPWVLAVLALCAAALAATWWWPQWRESIPVPGVVDPGVQRLEPAVRIESETLPEQPPASRFNAAQGVLMHPDFALLLDPQEEAIAREADFLAWYASGASELPEAVAEGAHPDAPTVADGTETTDAQF